MEARLRTSVGKWTLPRLTEFSTDQYFASSTTPRNPILLAGSDLAAVPRTIFKRQILSLSLSLSLFLLHATGALLAAHNGALCPVASEGSARDDGPGRSDDLF